MNTLIFHIKTVSDVDAGRRLYSLDGLSDEDVLRAIGHMRHQQTGSEEQPVHLQRIIAISVLRATSEDMRLESLSKGKNSTESTLLSQFYNELERSRSSLVSWGGCDFSLPVIHLRSLLHAVPSPHYWTISHNNSSDSMNRGRELNSLYQFGEHTDLSKVLAGDVAETVGMLVQLSAMLGFGDNAEGSEAQNLYLQGDVTAIQDSCELDALRVYLLYLRFELMRGRLTQNDYEQQIARLTKVAAGQHAEFADRYIRL